MLLLQSRQLACTPKGYEMMGKFYLGINQADSAEHFLKTAEQLYHQAGCTTGAIIFTYKFLAQVYYTKNDFAKAQEYSLQFLQAAEASGNLFEQASANTMIAQLFNQTNQADKGIIYTSKAVKILPGIKDTAELMQLLNLLAKRFLWHYQDTKSIHSLDSSELMAQRLLTLSKKANDSFNIAKSFSNLEGVAYEKGDTKKAISFIDSTFTYIGNEASYLATNYSDKAELLIEMKRYTEAAAAADSALKYRLESKNPVYIAAVYELQSTIASLSGNYKSAYEKYRLAKNVSDSLRNTERTKQVAELEKKYNQAKNENTIKQLDQQKKMYALLAIAGLLGLGLLGVFIRQQSLKSKHTILEAEQRLNRSRMNPHFFFNALSSLQTISLQQNDGRAVATNLAKFSKIMRQTLESSYQEYVSIEEEKKFLNTYLELQQIRFPQHFTYEILAAYDIDTEDTFIPAMILQPFAENSVEHGFANINYAGHIAINFKKEGNELHIMMADNGKGLSIKDPKDEEHISRASQIIKDRIYLLNRKLKTKATFDIRTNKEGKGVTVLIKLPLIYKQDIKK